MKTHRTAQLIVAGALAAAVAVPAAQAGAPDRVQVAGSLVAPGQVSEAQLNAGHNPSTRRVQIGGAQVAPSQVSAWESSAGGTAAQGASTDSSSGIGTGSIAAFAVLGFLAILAAASAVIFRHRRRLVTT
jgi:hypothetical protein